MRYFKSQEIQDTYHVSKTTVHNWITSARQGKLNLKLHKENDKTYIANDPQNILLLEDLAMLGKKKRNTRYHKTVTPSSDFYQLYSPKQVLDIISNLNIHHEIPRQYNFIGDGASNWDKHVKRLVAEGVPNLLSSTIDLLKSNFDSIDLLLEDYELVNVIDIGPGNGLPVRDLLARLLKQGKIHRYIAIDISPEMLQITRQNLEEWFGSQLKFEGYVRDITHERFDDLIVGDMLSDQADNTLNLALLLGATPMNFRSPTDTLKVICNSLSENDLLIYTDRPDSEIERKWFEFSPNPGSRILSPNHRYIFDLLNIDPSFYEVEMGFDEQKRVRFIRTRLNTALTINFEFEKGKRKVNFDKGDTILLWRVWHMTALEIISDFERSGLTLLQSSLTKNRQYLLTISGVDVNSNLKALAI